MDDQEFSGRRRHVRKNIEPVPLTVRDQQGRSLQGSVINVSVGGLALYLDSIPASKLLDIQLHGTKAWTRIKVENSRPLQDSRFVVGCSFLLQPSPDFLKALSGG